MKKIECNEQTWNCEEEKHVKLLTSVPALTNCVDISSNNEKERVKIRLLEQTQNIMLLFQDWEKSVMLTNCKAAIFQLFFFVVFLVNILWWHKHIFLM